MKKELGNIEYTGIRYTSGYRTGNMTYAYVQQTLEVVKHGIGININRAVANIAWKGDLVVAFGHSFVKIIGESSQPQFTNPLIIFVTTEDFITSGNVDQILHIDTAIERAEDALNGKHNGHPPKLEYFLHPDGHLALAHVIQIQNENLGTWFKGFIDAYSGELLSSFNFVCHGAGTASKSAKLAVPKLTEGNSTRRFLSRGTQRLRTGSRF